MLKSFAQKLKQVRDTTVTAAASGIPDENGSASIVLNFSNGTVSQAFGVLFKKTMQY
jgi:hypothetical protein